MKAPAVINTRPGDIYLTHGNTFVGQAIRLGEWLRKPDRPYRWYTHSGVIVGWHGEVIEAREDGIRRNTLYSYEPGSFTIIDTARTVDQRAAMLEFAQTSLGDGYGFLTIACIALNIIFPWEKLTFGVTAEMVCSGFCARALEHGGVTFPAGFPEPVNLTPADLARFFGILPRA